MVEPAWGAGPPLARRPHDSVVTQESRAVALVRGAAPLRRAFAAVAGRLVAARAWERLGFARLADYARERTGLSARQVQDLAHVDGALARLPAVEAAFVAGALSWTKARLLCRVATAEDEGRWVRYAQGVTALALAREVRALDAGSVEAGALETDEDGAAEEARAGITVRCTARANAKFHRARWLARRVAGEELPSWGCMEAVAAEAVSALGLEAGGEEAAGGCTSQGDEGGCTEPEKSGGCWPPRRRGGGAEERVHDEGPAPRSVRGPGPLPPANGCAPHASARGLLAGLAEADAFELDARLRRAVALEQRIEADAAPLLLAIAEGRLHRLLGFATLDAWARERLGISPRKLRALLRLARASVRAPELGSAFAAGALTWVQAHALVPVVLAAEGAEARRAWIGRAAALSARRLAEEVDTALMRQTGARSTAVVGTEAEREPETDRFFFVGPAEVVRLFRAARLGWQRSPRAARARGLRARRLALHGAGLHELPEPPRPPRALPLRGRLRCAREPHHALRLAPPARRPPGARPLHRLGARPPALRARAPPRARPARRLRPRGGVGRVAAVAPVLPYAGHSGCQGRSRSKARAARSTRSSRWRGATICMPIGSPRRERPARTVAAGCHDRLNGIVNDATPAIGCRRPSISSGNGPLAGGGS
jgi:hypothetical protein